MSMHIPIASHSLSIPRVHTGSCTLTFKVGAHRAVSGCYNVTAFIKPSAPFTVHKPLTVHYCTVLYCTVPLCLCTA